MEICLPVCFIKGEISGVGLKYLSDVLGLLTTIDTALRVILIQSLLEAREVLRKPRCQQDLRSWTVKSGRITESPP